VGQDPIPGADIQRRREGHNSSEEIEPGETVINGFWQPDLAFNQVDRPGSHFASGSEFDVLGMSRGSHSIYRILRSTRADKTITQSISVLRDCIHRLSFLAAAIRPCNAAHER